MFTARDYTLSQTDYSPQSRCLVAATNNGRLSVSGLTSVQGDNRLTRSSYSSKYRLESVSNGSSSSLYKPSTDRTEKKTLPLLRVLSLPGKRVHRAVP
jgi:hypothetical protein